MKHLGLLLSFFTILFVACQSDPTDNTNSGDTTFTLEVDAIELGGKGGSYSLTYTINNGIEGIDIVASCESDWITNLRTEDGAIHFDYAENFTNDKRTTAIFISYPNAKSKLLKVTQQVNSNVTFALEVVSKTTTTCETKITPSDSDTIYIAYMSELTYINSAGIDSAQKLFTDDYNYFMSYTEGLDVPMLKEFFLANDFAYQGNQTITWNSMIPTKEYVLYVYAIEFNAENNDYSLASPITYQLLTLNNPARTTIKFDVQIEVAGPVAAYDITPINWDGSYYVSIYQQGDYMYRDANNPADDAYAELVADTWIDMVYNLLISGYNTNDILEYMCLRGNDSYDEILKGDTSYALVIYAINTVDGIPQVVSTPQIFNFRTEVIGASDMTFDIKVENKYVRVADITITPTTNEPYTAAIVAKSEVPDLENSELIVWLNDNLTMETYRGEIRNHINRFSPEMEYSVFVYGYWGDVVTTDLFRYDFTMDAESKCENSVLRIEYGGPYSLLELSEYDPDNFYIHGTFESIGWYGMWAEIFTEHDTPDLFFSVYAADKVVVDPDWVFQDLIAYTSNKTQVLVGENDKLYIMCAVAMDYRGNYSEMWMSNPFSFHYDASTKRPLSELVEKVYGATPIPQQAKATHKGVTNHLVK